MRLMSLTRDTSHSPIGPCGPLKHSPLGDNLRHVSTAPLSCTLDCGENAGVGTVEAVGLSFHYYQRGRLDRRATM